MINLQISRAKWTPVFLQNLIPEFLDYIVSLVEANKPFLAIVKSHHNEKSDFYLHAPEAGGSSILLIPDLIREFPHSEIAVLCDNLTTHRQNHFTKIMPPLVKQITNINLSDVAKSTNSCEKIVISINNAHLLSDAELVEQIKKMTEVFDQIIIGEGNNKSVRQVIGMLLLSPLVALFCGPFVKPLKWSRLFFTYIIPLVPIMIAWDGIVALFKIRSPEKIKILAESNLPKNWIWTSGKSQNNRGGFVIYLHGKKGG